MAVSDIAELREAYKSALWQIAQRKHIQATDQLEKHLERQTLRYSPCNLIILSGISGAGKTTVGAVLSAHKYQKLRNVYTRPARVDETTEDGIFIDDTTFVEWKNQGKFLFTSNTNNSQHGLLRSELAKLDKPNVKFWADKSVHSTAQLLPFIQNYKLVYLLPPSFDILWDRIQGREQSNPSLQHSEIVARFTEEIAELQASGELPYQYLVNDSVDRVYVVIR